MTAHFEPETSYIVRGEVRKDLDHKLEDAFEPYDDDHTMTGGTWWKCDTPAPVVDLGTVANDDTVYPDNNPKTLLGAKKPDLSVVPASSLLHLALAMTNGSEKYGAYNYRDKPVSSRTYVAAAMRHLLAYLDGEDFSADTVATGRPVHHLGHVMACCAILLDTTEVGTLIDNRPAVKGRAGAMIEQYNLTQTF
jgi:hypothetical protein